MMKFFSRRKIYVFIFIILVGGWAGIELSGWRPWQQENVVSPVVVPGLPLAAVTSSGSAFLTSSIALVPQKMPVATASKAVVTVKPTSTSTRPNTTKSISSAFWQPTVGDTFQWLFESSLQNQTTPQADVYDVDMFDVSTKVIAELHAKKKRVVCYISVGSFENWRPDKDSFPDEVLGNDYSGWEGERWLDVRNLKVLGPLMKKRFELAKAKGCDGIDADNITGFDENTGFTITAAEQLTYNRYIASLAHSLGMSIGQKNDGAQINDLINYYDWAIIESCADQGWCALFRPYPARGKAVFQVEYSDSDVDFKTFCAEAKNNKFSAQLKHRNLDAWQQLCP
jgi:hypothetical protein